MFGPLLDSQLVTEAIGILLAAPRVRLVTHIHPDGDAIGSALSLSRALRMLGKQTQVVCKDSVPAAFQFLAGSDEISSDLDLRADDVVVTLDCGDVARTGFVEELRSIGGPHGRIINVDHHLRNDLHKVARYNLVSIDASSASELVYELVTDLGVRIDKLLATSLLTGIYTDTGGFRHSNTTPRVLEIASTLMLSGGRLRDITRNIANFRSVTALRLWGVALERIRYHESLDIVASVITHSDLATCGALIEDIAGAVNLINHVPNAKVAILCTEPSHGIVKASLRTESNAIDVARLANLFGGGGLKKAAGFSIPGAIQVDTDGSWRIMAATGESMEDLIPFDLLSPAIAREIAIA